MNLAATGRRFGAPFFLGLAILGGACAGLSVSPALASSCRTVDPTSVQIAKSIGDVYDQLASDGDEEFPSYFAKLTYARGDYAITWSSHHSKYASQHEGSQTDTVVHTIAGPTIDVPWFNPTEQTNETRIERCTGWERIYVGLGYLETADNVGYPLGYSGLHGPGLGVERYADDAKRWDLFTDLYYYPAAQSAYGPRTLTFQVTTFDGGFRLKIGTRTGMTFGLYQEIREIDPAIPTRTAQLVRVAPFAGFSEKL